MLLVVIKFCEIVRKPVSNTQVSQDTARGEIGYTRIHVIIL